VAILEAWLRRDANGAHRIFGHIHSVQIDLERPAMGNLSAAWLYPIIAIAGVLQAWGPPMNNALKKVLR
jgi:hypothetical protein